MPAKTYHCREHSSITACVSVLALPFVTRVAPPQQGGFISTVLSHITFVETFKLRGWLTCSTGMVSLEIHIFVRFCKRKRFDSSVKHHAYRQMKMPLEKTENPDDPGLSPCVFHATDISEVLEQSPRFDLLHARQWHGCYWDLSRSDQ